MNHGPAIRALCGALLLALLAPGPARAAGCPTAPAFPPDDAPAPSGWKHRRHAWIDVYGPPAHRAHDVVAVARAPQRIVAKFAYGLIDKDLSDEWVDVYVQPEPPCGAWRHVGEGTTSDDDAPQPRWGVEDDGGRLYFELPAGVVRGPGRYPVRLRVRGDGSEASLTLYVVRPGTGAVVFDIDGTLTTDDFQIVRQVLRKLRDDTYTPEAYDGALAVVRRWAARGYLPVYVTGRPDVLHALTRAWLRDRGFPPGPLRLTDRTREALPTDDGVAAYKTRVLRALREGPRLAIAAAYGNAGTDITAYRAAGVPSARTFVIGPNAGAEGTTAVASYPAHLEATPAPPEAPVPAPAPIPWPE